jgi:flagellar biosynthesis/type III secretory pathway chaperone
MQSQQSTQCARSLFPLLQQQLEQVSDFSSYLEEIKQAITHNDKDQLNQLLSATKLDVESIEQLQLKQLQIVAEYGFTQSAAGLDECVNACQLLPLSKLHSDLKQQLQHLQNALLVNDLLIRKNQQRVRQSIRLLSGHQAASNSMTYSSSGNTREDIPDSHSLARA